MIKQLFFSIVLLFAVQFGFSSSENSATPSCPVPTALVAINVSQNSVHLGWTENGVATTWQVIAITAGAPAPLPNTVGWMYSNSNPFTFVNLIAGNTYLLYVRAVCPAGDYSDWSSPVTVTLPPGGLMCGGVFTDLGGPSGDYLNDSNSAVIICPSIPGDVVTVIFSSFNTEAGVDILRAYDGNSVSAPMIPSTNPGGGYWGNAIPAPITATNPSGCLTFVFTSNSTVTLSGWEANIFCSPSSCFYPVTNLNVANITNTSALVSWTNLPGAFLQEVLVQTYDSPPPILTSMGMYSQTNSFVVSNLNTDVCYSVYVRSSCEPGTTIASPWSAPVNFCMYNCENNASCLGSLNLIAFLDANNNGTKESGEDFFNYGTFSYSVNSGPVINGVTNSGSFQIFENNPVNNYTLDFSVNANLATYCSASATYSNVTVPAGSGSNTYYFPVSQVQPYNDLEVSIIPFGVPIPGFTYQNNLYYKNKGFQTVPSGTVTFTKDPLLSITNISQSGTTTLPNGFSYNFSNLAPGEIRSINVSMQVPTIPIVALGNFLTNAANVTPAAGDVTPNDNNYSLSQTVVGSYDPNDKMEARGGKIPMDTFANNDYLIYTIRFENTGTANTQFIRVEDELNALLNAGSVEVLEASHPFNFRRINNKLIWNFYSISLPPTSTNPLLSHGYVRFKVKPVSGFGVGTVIPNFASIFFDYNPPIITDTFNVEFVAPLSTIVFESGNFVVYPNPANDMVTFSMATTTDKLSTIFITDMLGKTAKTIKNIDLNEASVAIADISPGMYLVEITTVSNLKTTKKLVIK